MGQIRPVNEIAPFPGSHTCSACFIQDNSLRYTDFDAACDRGYGPDVGEDFKGGIQLDSLVLCENCVTTAARQLGLTDEGSVKAELVDTERKLQDSEREAEKQAEYASRLEGVFDARPQPIKIPHRKRPRNREDD